MDQTIQAELERQQTSMLEKVSSVMDNKLESMKRQLQEASNTQMSELSLVSLEYSRRKLDVTRENRGNVSFLSL